MFNNFVYQNPVKILFGKGQIAQLGKQIPNDAKILLTYGGGSIFKNGVYEQVKQALKDRNIIEFGGIEANPTYETLMQAVELGRRENIDYLLAVGGGSVLDGTKFIAAAIPYDGEDAWQLVTGKAKVKQAIPIGSVLTLPATGSEMNFFAVISRKETHEKKGMGHPLLYPAFSILDPETTYSLPQKQIANGIADAFTHVMEQYMTYPVNAEIQDRMAESVLQTLIAVAPKTLGNPTDYEARANFMWAATVALNGLISVGVPQDWATHEIGHELTAAHGIDHARTLAVVLPHLLKIKKEDKSGKLIQYAQRVWNLSGTNDELIEGAIQKTIDFYESLDIPTKANAYGIGQETVDKIVKRFEEGKVVLGERHDITPEVVGEILGMSIG
ncbi:iron-containing alcohol dehydrogenase [Emticicia agri]|uniref:Iron-containing alcohol dehydrogenase n=1 Tax=Emticicia agri TaxID=2492393 RepID=A0A4Q5M5F2_9BACT|nr:iron-containing alcohol dehydrogenase [Emticicia agri]RYU97736.1 iron-containing alcohol dehydrogenase [Emticicia agri]